MGILGWVTGILLFGLAVAIDGVIRVVEHNAQQNAIMPTLAPKPAYKPIHIKV